MWRKMMWYLHGRSAYTREGYLRAAKHFNPEDLNVDASQRIFMVTGANSGLGLVCAREFARRGGTVHMLCRNQQRGEDARQQIIKETGNDKVELHVLDMGDVKAIRKFTDEYVKSGRSLDVLVNNAGCMIHERKLTPEGLEQNFAVNTFGHYVLTMSLLPLLVKSQSPRIIMMSSGGMLLEKLNAEDPQLTKMEPFDGVTAYSQEKRQQVELARCIAERNPGVFSVSTHPGWADTDAFREALPDFYEKMKDNVRTPEQGADTAVWLALAANVPLEHNGCFFEDRKAIDEHLFLARTRSTHEERTKFVDYLEQLANDLHVLP